MHKSFAFFYLCVSLLNQNHVECLKITSFSKRGLFVRSPVKFHAEPPKDIWAIDGDSAELNVESSASLARAKLFAEAEAKRLAEEAEKKRKAEQSAVSFFSAKETPAPVTVPSTSESDSTTAIAGTQSG